MIEVKKLSELSGHNGAVYALERSEEGNCFYSGSGDKIVAKWNLDSLCPEKFSAQLPAIVYSLCYISKKNLLLAGTSEGKIHAISLSEKKETKVLLNHNQPVYDLKVSSQEKAGVLLAAGGDGVVSIISTEDLSTLKLIRLCNEKIRSIDICENKAAIACGDGFIRIIDLKELKVMNEFQAHTGSVYAVKFSPDGMQLLSGGKDAHLKAWRTEDARPDEPFGRGTWMMERSIPAHNYAIYSLVFSPDGKYFATASRDKTIKIWNAGSFEVLTRINKENSEGHINSVNKLLWTNQGLVSAGDDRKVMVWEVV